MKLDNILWLFIGSFVIIFAVFLIKQYLKTKKNYYLILSSFCYFILIYAYTIILVSNDISIIYPILNSMTIIIIVLIGVFFYNEKIDELSIFAIIMIIASILILSYRS